MPQTFTDNEGRDWILRVNPFTLGEIEERLGVSFSAAPEDQEGPAIRIATDYLFCFRVIWVLVEKQAKERGLGSEDLGDALVGEVMGKAQAALCQALADFQPDPNRRAAMGKMFSVIQQAEQAAVAKGVAVLDQLDIDKIVTEALSDAGT